MQGHRHANAIANPDVQLKQCVIIKNEFNYKSFISFSHFFLAAFYHFSLHKKEKKRFQKSDEGISRRNVEKKRIRIIIFHVFMHRILLWFLLYPFAIMRFLCINMENIFSSYVMLERLKKLKVLNSFASKPVGAFFKAVYMFVDIYEARSWQIKLRGNNIKYVMDEHEQDKE